MQNKLKFWTVPLQIESNASDTKKLSRIVVDCATQVITVNGFNKYL